MKLVYLFSFFLLLVGCNSDFSEQQVNSKVASDGFMDQSQEEEGEPPMSPPQQSGNEEDKEVGSRVEKKIIRDGNMEVEVKDLNRGKVFVDSILRKFDGYYENELYESNTYRSAYDLKIRVPAIHFDALVHETTANAGKVTSRNIHARDVTAQFYDLKTRLENNESYLLQYRSLLKRARTIEEILEVQEKIRVLEEEMDAKKGRLKLMSDQVNYSTLRLRLYQQVESTGEAQEGFFAQSWRAIQEGGGFFIDVILLLLRLWPFALLIGTSIYLFRKWRRRNKA